MYSRAEASSHVKPLSSQNPEPLPKPSKNNSLLFVALNILWIGGLVVAAVGMAALGANQGWWAAKSLEALTNVKAIIMITIGGASALVGIVWVSVKKSSFNSDRTEPRTIDLPSFYTELREKILKTPKYVTQIPLSQEFPSDEMVSLFTHQHEVMPHVFLGDYRAFLSIDPQFLAQHEMVDPLEDILGREPNVKDKKWAKDHLDYVGCSNKNIKKVISVTNFKPGNNVAKDDWSRFKPDLPGAGITFSFQIDVDDDDSAWALISPNLYAVFEEIDKAIFYKQNILIHCTQGINRSASVICAYMMAHCGVTLDQALNYVQCIRHQVHLKPALRKGLEGYEEHLKALRKKKI